MRCQKASVRGRMGKAPGLVAALLLLLGASWPALAAFPGQNGRIAFDTDRSGTVEIGVMNPGGAGFRFLTAAPGQATDPAWSADGLSIAFASDSAGGPFLFVMHFDGSGVVQITSGDGVADSRPAWSPDGMSIAFERMDVASSTTSVWVVGADGTNPMSLTAGSMSNDGQPAWAPDGTKIAFVSDRAGNRDVFVMNADGSSPTDLTNDPGDDREPNWSPSGTSIAFTSNRSGTDSIWTMNADGSSPTMLTDGLQADSQPAFSPDGTLVLFVRALATPTIHVMNADGSDVTRLTFDDADDQKPDWEPVVPGTNLPPVANAGPDQQLECTSPAGAVATLDGSASTDPDSTPGTNDDIVLFEWWQDYGLSDETFLGTGETLEVTFPLGAHDVTLQVTDKVAQTARDDVIITVVDTTPPTIAVSLSPSVLWPPDHRYVPVHANVVAHDICGPVTVVLDSVVSSEPDQGHGSGHTSDDILGARLGTADFDFFLRAERSGNGTGRTYTATYTATDASGNAASASAGAVVPHDQGKGKPPAEPPGKSKKGNSKHR